MKKCRLPLAPAVLSFLFALNACNSGNSGKDYPAVTDTALVATGKAVFTRNCSSCHEFGQDGIGPQLSGITSEVSAEWLLRFIKNPQEVIASGDKRADSLLKRYKSVMPPFAFLSDGEVKALLAFLGTAKATDRAASKGEAKGIADPIPQKIGLSPLTVNLKPVAQFPFAGENQLPHTRITKLAFQPQTKNLFVIDLRGKLYKLKGNKPVVYLDIAKRRPHFITEPGLATGFGSFAFHPDFARNGLLYTTHTEAPGSGNPDFSFEDTVRVTVQWVLTEWKISDLSADTLKGPGRELLRINMVEGAHGVQELAFNTFSKPGTKDYGLLYMGMGDGASVQVGFPFITHDRARIYGSIIRIDPLGNNSANGKYGIPSDNPFVHDRDTRVVHEIYAYGFRNPHRITWTSSGDMLVSHIGQANIEALDLVKPGLDFGWPIREGSFAFNAYGDLNNIYPLPANDSLYRITYPVAQFDHDEGNAISGGYEYNGNRIPLLKGKFLFGDIPSGRLFYVNTSELKQGSQATIKEWVMTINGISQTLKKVCGSDRVDLHFGEGPDGEIYILTKADGRLYRIDSAENN